MKAGLFHNIPFEDYAAIKAVNHGAMEAGMRSMVHMRYHVETPEARPDTPALAFGRNFHTALLEPDKWKPIIVPVDLDRRTKAGKEAWESAWLAAQGTGGTVVYADTAEMIAAMVAAVHAHPTASGIVRRQGARESVAVWNDKDTGLLCKARIDWFTIGIAAADVKTCLRADPRPFGWAASKYGYHRQAAHYIDGFEAVAGKATPFVFLAVEKDAPHGVSVCTLSRRAIEIGRAENRDILRQWAAALAAGKFEGYPTDVQVADLPTGYVSFTTAPTDWEANDGEGDTDTGPF